MFEKLSEQLAKCQNAGERHFLLQEKESVKELFSKIEGQFSIEEQCVLAQIAIIGQLNLVFGETLSKIDRSLLEKFVSMDAFYREMGGIVGYQTKVLRLLKMEKEEKKDANYHSPFFHDITKENQEVHEAISWGIEAMADLAEIYPLGGAADRLHLVEEKTGVELPAAKLGFAGRMLLEHLIRDLQAREFLYFQKYGKQIVIPIAIMTSHEKNNHAHVIEIFEQMNWFNRPKDSVRFFTQPLVPAVTADGNWCMMGPGRPLMKPGGHGAIWKLAKDCKIFEWLESLGKKKALIRQINNPIAGLDYGLLAFSGIGWKQKMVFGFASAPRLLQSAEGVNVLIERGNQVVLSNIEYCDFEKFGIEDSPMKEGDLHSRFSSNTNILFVDLQAVSKAVEDMPFPGLLINLKKVRFFSDTGEEKEELVARLESTMQNIADVFVEEKKEQLRTSKTFVTYNQRHKTISTAKKAFVAGGLMQETPENCFYDLLFSHRELLLSCGFDLPERRTLEEYLKAGPEVVFLYHPSLGPLYSHVRKKLQGGALGIGSEFLLEIADFQAKNLKIHGSLQVIAEQPMGLLENEVLQYSKNIAQCVLENVTIENRGIDWKKSAPFWKMDLKRMESVKIILKGNGRFRAKNLHLKGNHLFVVENGQILEI
jgi:hypothetical protein